jgi:hypothetical protein
VPLLAAPWKRPGENVSQKRNKTETMKNTLISKPIRNARNTAGGVFGIILAMAAVLGCLLAHGAPAEVAINEKPSSPPDQLYGIWIAKDVDAELGEVKIRLTFRLEKEATFMAWSDIPFVGKVRDLEGAFSVHGDMISSEALRDGKKANFSFKKDKLVLLFISGKVIHFDRE